MADSLDGIRLRVGEENLAESCTRDCCVVSLDGIPDERVIVDVDLAFPVHEKQGKRCDFIVFLNVNDNVLLVAPIELKSGNIDTGYVFKQLRGGVIFADEMAPKNSTPKCRPILVHGLRLESWQRKKLNAKKIQFRGRCLTVMTARCGECRNLASALGF